MSTPRISRPLKQGTRTNAEWLAALRAEGPEAAHAQAELRDLVLRGLAHGLAKHGEATASLEDFAHEAVIRILEKLDTFRDESRFSTWALAIALRVAFSALRRRRWCEVPFAELPEPGGAGAPGWASETLAVNPERAVARNEIYAALERAWRDALTPRQRAVILAELREMPQAEIAVRLGVNRNALYKLGHDARRSMLRALEEAGFERESVRAAFGEP